jgi:hypothetical protein
VGKVEKDKALSVFMGVSLGLLPAIIHLLGIWIIAGQIFTALPETFFLFLLLLLLGAVGGVIGGVVIGVVVVGVVGGIVVGGVVGGVIGGVVVGVVVGGVGGVVGGIVEEVIKEKREKLSKLFLYPSFFLTLIAISLILGPSVLAHVNLSQLERDREIFEDVSCLRKEGGIEIIFKDVNEDYIRNFYQIRVGEETITFAHATEGEVKFEYSEERRLLKKEEKEEVTKTSLLKVFVPFEDTLSEIEVIARHTFLNYRKTIPVTPIPET